MAELISISSFSFLKVFIYVEISPIYQAVVMTLICIVGAWLKFWVVHSIF
jgi:hypothetical protein